MALLSNTETTEAAFFTSAAYKYRGEVHIQVAKFQDGAEVRDIALWRFTSGGLTKTHEITIGLWDAGVCKTRADAIAHMRGHGVELVE